ncbi:metallo-aminopeptidase [Saccharomycopsis crataegensis]|uniref:Aminopeptidase n=1 Tax=Saccharomycopsis crataegensis TaxID=43959 RepID=A0AAV5QRS4_9ASCO|nr:metallo-aminopeptidase [Saccharomycopsis crataegensis]
MLNRSTATAMARRSSSNGFHLVRSPSSHAPGHMAAMSAAQQSIRRSSHHHSFATPLPLSSSSTSSSPLSHLQKSNRNFTSRKLAHFNSRLPVFSRSSTSVLSRSFTTSLAANMCSCSSAVDSTAGREILPTNVYPDHYYITLEPDFSKFTFDGSVTIDLDVKKTSSSVTLNYLELDIKSAKINGEPVSDIKYDEKKQEVEFISASELVEGTKAKIQVDFIGILNDQMAGFYRSTYKDEQGNTKYLATTQFEATDARRAFPCFDEPLLKSKFEVTLIADKELTTLANMLPKDEKDLGNGKKAVTFESTPLLSTYLVAFIVGDLRYVENNDYKIPVRVYTTPGLEKEGEFSAALAARTLKFFAKAFDIEYYLPHMNMVAIHDFSAGAMENLSLITYRAIDLLIDEKTASLSRKLRVSEVVQHELAHQWFGNLVTMKWWNDLWLNEAYATYCSYMVFEETENESFIFQNFEADTLSAAFRLDGLRSSHPIEVPVKKAGEINQIFDAISYSKGSCLLRMIAHWLGKDVFLKGVSNYLKKHKYGNAETADLWAALAEASGKDVPTVMDKWTKNIGYPVVTVTEDGNKIKLEQHRFLSTGDVTEEDDKVLYPLFVNLKTPAGVDSDMTLNGRETTFELKEGEDFFKVNTDGVGFYRTLYTPERWAKLGKAGSEGLLSTQDRTCLVEDAYSLAVSGYSSTTDFLNLVSGWTEESEFIVWSSILGSIGELRGVMKFFGDEGKSVAGLKALTRHLISAKINSLGWEFGASEAVLDQRLKAALFGAASSAEDPLVADDIKEKFAKFIAGDKEAINPNIKNAVFAAVARTGGEKEYDQFLEIYKNPSSLDEKLLALRFLGAFTEPALIQRTLKLALDPEVVKPQDIYIPLQGLRAHKEGVLALWQWFQDNWDVLVKRFPPSLNMLGNIVSLCTSGYLVPGARQEINKFFADKDLTGIDKNLEQALDSLESKWNWLVRDGEKVSKWLDQNGYKK